MRILHTSDWHLGRLFHRASLLDEQSRALDRIVELVRERSIELVLIAGDLYDRSIPPADAVELFDATLVRLHEAGAQVVAISGNHDSAIRVGYGDRLLERIGVTIRGDASRTGDAVTVTPDDGGRPVRVHPIPYLDPLATAHLARSDEPGDDCTDDDCTDDSPPDGVGTAGRRFTHHDAMSWAMRRVRADLAAHPGTRSIVVAHAFLTGGDPSESERDLSIGNVEQVRLDVFEGIDYVALGHLHLRQQFDGGRVAYSGTPLPYSFPEQRHTKSVRIIELADDGSIEVEQVPLGVGRAMRTLTGELESMLSDPSLADAEDAWVQALLTDRHLPLQAMARLQQRFPHAVELRHRPEVDETQRHATDEGAVDVRRADPLELSIRFLDERRGVTTDDDERALLDDALLAAGQGVTR